MSPESKNILAVNGGSSSIKFALYEGGGAPAGKEGGGNGPLVKKLSGKIERIGLKGTKLTFTRILNDGGRSPTGKEPRSQPEGGEGSLPIDAAGPEQAADFLISWLQQQDASFSAVGHRVVHGLQHREAAIIDDQLLKELYDLRSIDPDHLPGEIELIELFRRRIPGLMQVACFDTAFHSDLPRVARLLPIPRRFDEAGIQRYGFHGLSYSYIMEELSRIAGPAVAGGAVIIAHLGNGASLAAVKDGRSIDTTMGFTPAGGIVMGTRPGDLDPGVAWYILQKEQLTAAQFNDLINHQSGLLGVSGTSSDMQDLLARESSDHRAAEAVALFCYQVKKSIGAFSAALGGLDTLVFTGGIGEKAALIRSRICAGLEYLGIGLDSSGNENNEVFISGSGHRVGVYAIPTDEEQMIARTVLKIVNH